MVSFSYSAGRRPALP